MPVSFLFTRKTLHTNSLENLTLSCAGVADDAHVDVTPEICSLVRLLSNATKQHEQHASLYFLITWQHVNKYYINSFAGFTTLFISLV